MPRLAVPALVMLCLAALPGAAETAKGVAKPPVVPPADTTGVAEMKWQRLPGVPYICKSGELLCICTTGSDVVDCRAATASVKKAD